LGRVPPTVIPTRDNMAFLSRRYDRRSVFCFWWGKHRPFSSRLAVSCHLPTCGGVAFVGGGRYAMRPAGRLSGCLELSVGFDCGLRRTEPNVDNTMDSRNDRMSEYSVSILDDCHVIERLHSGSHRVADMVQRGSAESHLRSIRRSLPRTSRFLPLHAMCLQYVRFNVFQRRLPACVTKKQTERLNTLRGLHKTNG
jgi:hypothetical protein